MPRTFHLFCLYIVLLTLLPSGSIFGVNVKMLVFIPLLILSINLSLAQKEGLQELTINIAIISTFLAWAMLSEFYPVFTLNMALVQYKDVITTLIGCWFVRIFTLDDSDRIAFIKLCLSTVLFGCFLKILMFCYSLYTGRPTHDVMDMIDRVFGVKLMSLDFGDVGARIEFISDTLLPICLFVILCLRNKLGIGRVRALAMVGLFLLSSVFTFSRFLWGYTVVGVVLGLLVARKDKMHILYFGAAAAAVIYFFDQISILITLRFSDKFVDSSDIERTIQKISLKRFFFDAPIFGHGLGSYSTQSIRAPEFPYSYELQVLALFGQLGIVGMGLLTGILLNYYRKAFSFKRGARSYQASVAILLICFLASGFFNPNILSSTAAVSFGLLFALAALGSCHLNLGYSPQLSVSRALALPVAS
jgi:hypothetical protein